MPNFLFTVYFFREIFLFYFSGILKEKQERGFHMSEIQYHFYVDGRTAVVDDIDIPKDVNIANFKSIYNEITSKSNLNVEIMLKDSQKQFPHVKTLITDNICPLNVRNRMFPCLETLIQNGQEVEYLVDHFQCLKNVFFQPKSGVLDFRGLYGISDYALEGIHECTLQNTSEIFFIEEHAFDNSWIEELSKTQDVVFINNILAYVNNSVAELDIPENIDAARKKVFPPMLKRVTIHTPYILSELRNTKIHALRFDELSYNTLDSFLNLYRKESFQIENYEASNQGSGIITVNGMIYSEDMEKLYACPSGKTGKIVIPEGVKLICEHAFAYSSLESVAIPDSVANIGRGAFMDSHIKTIKIGKGIKDLSSYYSYGIFQGCHNLKNIEIPSNIKKIGISIFKESGLESITFNEGLEWIESNCFENTRIKEISLPESLQYCGNQNFIDVENIHVKKVPKNLVYSLFSKKNTRNTIAEIECNGKKCYIGKAYTKYNLAMINDLVEDDLDKYQECQIMMCKYPEDKQEIAYRIFKDNGQATDESVMSYLKKVSFNLAERYYQNEMYQELQELLSYNILSKSGLDKLLKLSTEGNNAVITAYITQAINKEKQNVSFRL